MNFRTLGKLGRPSVAALGTWKPEILHELSSTVFPNGTVFHSETALGLRAQIHPREADLFICSQFDAGRVAGIRNPCLDSYVTQCHSIVFTSSGIDLPGPHSEHELRSEGPRSESHEFFTNDEQVPELLASPLQQTLALIPSAHGRATIRFYPEPNETTLTELRQHILFGTKLPFAPMAVHYKAPTSGKMVACFSVPVHDTLAWIRAISLLWAEAFPDAFPGLGEWEKEPSWMTAQERQLSAKLAAERASFAEQASQFRLRESSILSELASARIQAAAGPRRIITTQGAILVEAVHEVLADLGFEVHDVDTERPEGSQKREDLRLKDSDLPRWEAIVEVKGYSKSGGKGTDLLQLERHASKYIMEFGYPPSKKLYVVNGQHRLPPAMRRPPWAPNEHEPNQFGSDGGLIVPTIDLFRLHRDRHELGLPKARSLLRDSSGLFSYSAPL